MSGARNDAELQSRLKVMDIDEGPPLKRQPTMLESSLKTRAA